ncbi:MAG: thioredoxin [Burkholderiales bacterium]
MTQHTVDVFAGNFEREVIEASKSVPVVVDFWAPWCGPCRVLKPILEKLAEEYGGKFRLAKLNSDENQEIAGAYGVRSIPDVMGFRDGKPVAHFLGAVPESQVRAFIDSLIPSPSEAERARARELREAGDTKGAIAALHNALELDVGNELARLDLAEALIETQELDEADALLSSVRQHIDWDERVATLRAAIAFARSAESGPGEAELIARLSENPGDCETRFALANLYAGAKRYRQALDELLQVVRQDKTWKDGAARKRILAIFNLAEDQPDLVSEYRRKLSSALY